MTERQKIQYRWFGLNLKRDCGIEVCLLQNWSFRHAPRMDAIEGSEVPVGAVFHGSLRGLPLRQRITQADNFSIPHCPLLLVREV